MEQKFKQYVYCGKQNNHNYPIGLDGEDLITGALFNNSSYTQIGIQAPPGTKFYVNASTSPAIVGYSGLFEVDFQSGGLIGELHFDRQSIEYIEQNDSAMLIIDLAYVEGGAI